MDKTYVGPWSFKHHPWLKEMHDDQSPRRIGQKAAQIGYTEWAMNTGLHCIDINRRDVLYVLPNVRPDAADFSSARFDAALDASKHISAMFSDVKNVGHKKAGTCNFYIRGSNGRSGLKSIPVSLLILDEVDEMEQENIPLAEERLSGQLVRQILMLSTPTIPDYGINYYFQKSTEDHFYFPCPSCSRYIEFRFPESLVVLGEDENDPKVNESYLKCYECDAVLPHEDKVKYLNKGLWRPSFAGRDDRGFYCNQLYAMHLEPKVIAKKWHEGQKDPSAEQEVYNSKGGLPHVVAGARLTDQMIDACIGDYVKKDSMTGGLNTMGVDQGKILNVVINNWQLGAREGVDVNSNARPRLVQELELKHFEELDELMMKYSIAFCVVDANPETRKALEFANRFYGMVKLCRYPQGQNGRNITTAEDQEHTIHVHRTSWLDLTLGRFRNGTITLPRDVSYNYKNQIKAQVRIPKKDKDGNPVNRYETPGNRPDHFGHAQNYAEIALPFAIGMGVNSDMRG